MKAHSVKEWITLDLEYNFQQSIEPAVFIFTFSHGIVFICSSTCHVLYNYIWFYNKIEISTLNKPIHYHVFPLLGYTKFYIRFSISYHSICFSFRYFIYYFILVSYCLCRKHIHEVPVSFTKDTICFIFSWMPFLLTTPLLEEVTFGFT